ncbi:uncharacterized protein LOC103868475 [Brassica rapa]|uniref:uncharacterized protein LOC103868475 n=1 Tax=Brassica campestris TaxID=3711 RepID=UPI0004F154E4|nr:uncharacterized protein LOC103868475 [Brassica rapa]
MQMSESKIDRTIYTCLDRWTPLGKLIEFIEPTGPRDPNLHISASVADACNSKGWKLPSPRSENALTLHIHLTTLSLPNQALGTDTYHWIINATDCRGFSSTKTWEALRLRAPVKQWKMLVWVSGLIPRHGFNMWLAHKRETSNVGFSRGSTTTDVPSSLGKNSSPGLDDRLHQRLRCSRNSWFKLLSTIFGDKGTRPYTATDTPLLNKLSR